MTPEQFERVQELFRKSYPIALHERPAFLDAHCAGDEEVRAKVERMLSHAEAQQTGEKGGDGDRFLESPAMGRGFHVADVDDIERHLDRAIDSSVRSDVNQLKNAMESPSAYNAETNPTDEKLPVARIGRYTLIRKLGEGGMGIVYEARQENPSRTVALKVIRPGLASPAVLKRFTHEAQILGQLQHPGIACIYEAGVADVAQGPSADTGPLAPQVQFFAMELVRGQTLTDYATERHLVTPERLELFARVCDAVHHAHQKGVIHRDLKPANILVVAQAATDAPVEGAVGRPKILDFGVARLTDADIQTVTMQTDMGQLIGTIPYMSPEQVLGDSRILDTRSDIYSLGIVLFELLSGRKPYDLRGKSLAESARIIAEQEPTSLGSIDTALRGELDTIVLKALEKERDRRYLSAADIAADIRRYIANEPITARPQTTFYLLRKFARRNRGLVIASAAAVMSLVVGLVVVSILAHREARQRRVAEHIAYRASIGSASAMLQNHDVAAARTSLEKTPQYLRGWEWRYLSNHLDDSLRSIEVGNAFRALAFMNQTGKIVVSCLPAYPPLSKLLDISSATSVQTDQPGIRYYSQSARGTATLWVTSDEKMHIQTTDSASAQSIIEPTCKPSATAGEYSYMPSDDGRLVLFRQHNTDRICVMETETGRRYSREVYLEAWHHTPVFVGDDSIASPIFDSQWIEIWNFRTGQTRNIAKHPATIESLAVSPDGLSIYTGSQDSMLRRWNIQSGDLEAMGQGHSGYLLYVACSPDGRLVATNSTDNTVRLWDATTLQARRIYHGHTTRIGWLVFAADGTRAISMTPNGNIRIWDTASSTDPDVRKNHRSFVYSVAFAPDGRRIVSAGWDGLIKVSGGVKIWDAGNYAPIAEIGGADELYFHAAFSPDGAKIAASGSKGLKVFDSATGQILIRRDDFGTGHHTLAFDPSGGRILVAGKFIDAATGKDLPCRIEDSDQVAWSRDGQWIATRSDEPNWIHLWDARSQRKVQELPGPGRGIGELTFSHDGRLLAAVADLHTTFVWSVQDGRLVASLDSPGGEALCAAFSPDGTRLATGGRDQLIHLWDTTTFEEVAQLHGHDAYVKTLAFSPDGTALLSGSGDRTIRIWDSRPNRDSSNAGWANVPFGNHGEAKRG